MPVNTSQSLVFLALLMASLPTIYVFFKVLESSAMVEKKGVVIGGAAAAFLVSFLLSYRILDGLSRPDLALTRDLLTGTWEFFNEEEPELYAVWTFAPSPEAPEELAVTGTVWRGPRTNLRDRRARQVVLSFGPSAVRFRDAGTLQFDYTSKLGSGSAELALTYGFSGRYKDDVRQTQPGQADTGGIALARGNIDREGTRLRWLLQAAITTVLLSWIAIGLTYILFRYFQSTATVSWKSLKLAGPFAFYYVFFSLCPTLLELEPDPLRSLSSDMLPGTWKLEYLDNRTRYGNVAISSDTRKLELRGDLFGREELPAGGSGFRGSMKGSDLRYDAASRELTFRYEAQPAGVGEAKLTLVPALVGYFVDRDDPAPPEEINTGALLGLKRLN